ncbi:phage tail tape measure protein [Staphylococcus intermedius]|uniref:phage tail tape measure protein n=1 Tax=Staphylococcus intermedius TaxID=1285 RepID=UPI000BBBEEE9|nr:phage tail tape measure protein [Staphylococcus intermedius]PCF86398.1 phage tail tape measure protein [Staphylococcus intermedius]
MDETLQGFTLEMKLDALGVQEGMKSLKRQLGVVNSEMKANLSAFDKSEKSMERYETQLKGLNERLKVQKQMFNQAEGELKQLNANYLNAKNRVKDVEKAYLNLVEANKKNKASLDKSNSALKESNTELKKSETQYKRTTQRKEEAYKKLKQLRQAEKDLKNSSSATTAQLKRANEAVQKQSAKHKALVAQYKEEGQQVKKLRADNEKLSNSNQKLKNTYDKTNAELKQTENEFKELNNTIKNHNTNLAKAQKAVNNEKASLNNLERTIAKTKSEMKAFNKEQIIAGSHFTKTANQAEAMSKRFGHLGDKMTSIGRTMTVGVTTPITLGFGASVKAAVDYEQALAGVAKTTDLSGSELSKMSNEITNMSKTMPFAATEISGVAEAAGQLGVKKSEITDFTKTMLDMSVATNLTSDEAATEFARFANAAGMPIDKVDRLGASVVALGNSTATTEKEIVEMGQRLAGAGSQAGFSADQIMSISAAMSSVGIEAEAGGTAMTQIFNKMTKATSEGGKTLNNFGKTAGMTGKEFAKTWEANPTKALSEFIKGLSKTEGGAKGVLKALDSVGIKGIREADTIRRLSNNHTILDKALRTGAKGWKENNALTNEAKTRYKTMGSQLQIFKNQLLALGKDIGNVVAPVVVGITKKFGQWAEAFTKLPKPIKGVSIALGLVAAATGPVVLGIGLLLRAVSSAAKGYASLNRRMAENSAEAIANAGAQKIAAGSLATSGKTTKGATGLFGTLGNTISLVTGRFGGLDKIVLKGSKLLGKVGLPLTILTTMFGVAYEKMGWFRQGFKDMGRIVNDVGESIDFSWISKMGDAWDDFKDDMAKGLQDGALFKGVHKLFDGIHTLASKASDKVDVLGKGVSKETKKALSSYTKYADQSDKIFEKIRYNHGKISKKEADELLSINKKMSDELIAQLEKRKARELKIDEDVLKESKVISDKRKQAILKQVEEEGNTRIQKAKELNAKIAELEAKALSNGKLSEKETKELQELYEQRNELAVKELSKGEKEQQRILSRMSANRKAMSIEEASETIKESIKARDRAKKNAKKRYDQRVDEINQMVGLSKTEKEKLLQEADDRYQKEKDKADKHHKKILKGVEDSNENVKREIDTSNGKVKSGFQKFWDGLKDRSKKAWGKMTDHAREFGKTMKGAGDWFKGLPKVVSKWFGKAYGSVKDYTGNIYERTKDKFQGAKDKAESSSKSVWKSTSKWFGKAYGSVKGYAEGMYSKAKSSFGDIASSAWDKAKSVYKGFHSWLSKTLSWIKNITSDFGKAASDLGKSVANKAVDGLNGMIGGINKIAKAITDKTLIKPIPRLSTGTYDGTTLATDSNGGLKAPTLAVLNDKGSGNAPGGGVQEVIHRADGTLHAPQGKDVVVPLGIGDSVINADDTKRLQGMGLLPRFHSGSKKKDWLDQIKDNTKHVAQNMLKGAYKGANHAKHVAKDKTKNVIEKAKEVGTDALEKAEDAAMGIWGGIKGVTKDVGEFLENPGKLVEKVMDYMKINFGNGSNATVSIVKSAYGILKKKLTDKVKSWFEEFGGDGDGSYIKYLDNITTPYSPNGPPPGYAFNWPHPGIDLPYHHEPIFSTLNGKAYNKFMAGGFGKYILVKSGALEAFYAHLSKSFIKDGQSVHAGQKLGISGGDPGLAISGASTGPHLHYEMHRNGKPINPVTWLKSHNGSRGGKTSGSGYTNARNAILKAQAILGGRYRSPFITNEMLRVAKRESNYTSDAVNNWDINAQRGTPSKGMFQMIEPSFRAYAIRGHGNMLNAVDEAISAMRYIVGKWVPIMGSWRSAFKRAGDYAYENGGLSTTHKLAQISEGNKPEMIVPLTKRTRAIQLIEQAMRYVGMETGTTNVTVNENNQMVEKLLKQMVAISSHNNRLTEAIVGLLKSPSTRVDPKSAEQLLSQLQGDRYAKTAYNTGG